MLTLLYLIKLVVLYSLWLTEDENKSNNNNNIYNQKKQKALLALPKVPSYSREDQFSILLPVLNDYSIIQKLRAIITNNTPSNNVLYWFI